MAISPTATSIPSYDASLIQQNSSSTTDQSRLDAMSDRIKILEEQNLANLLCIKELQRGLVNAHENLAEAQNAIKNLKEKDITDLRTASLGILRDTLRDNLHTLITDDLRKAAEILQGRHSELAQQQHNISLRMEVLEQFLGLQQAAFTHISLSESEQKRENEAPSSSSSSSSSSTASTGRTRAVLSDITPQGNLVSFDYFSSALPTPPTTYHYSTPASFSASSSSSSVETPASNTNESSPEASKRLDFSDAQNDK